MKDKLKSSLNAIKQYFYGLMYENDEPSLTRVIIALAFLLFAGISLYLSLNNITWGNYEIFAYVAGGGSICGKIIERATAIIKGSPNGQMPGPKNGGANNG